MILDATFLVKSKSRIFGVEDRSSILNPIIRGKGSWVTQNKIKKKLQKTGSEFFARRRGDDEQDLDMCVAFDD